MSLDAAVGSSSSCSPSKWVLQNQLGHPVHLSSLWNSAADPQSPRKPLSLLFKAVLQRLWASPLAKHGFYTTPPFPWCPLSAPGRSPLPRICTQSCSSIASPSCHLAQTHRSTRYCSKLPNLRRYLQPQPALRFGIQAPLSPLQLIPSPLLGPSSINWRSWCQQPRIFMRMKPNNFVEGSSKR